MLQQKPSAPDSNSRAGAWRSATLQPFQHRIFLAIWTASLVSNFGSLIQGVGASWLMTSIAPSADMVALVQAASSLPIMLFSLVAGAAADVWDRRLVMLVAQLAMLLTSAALSLLAVLGLVTPSLLLALTFLLGCGAALYGPAWQSSVGEQVPRDALPAAVALNSLGFNIARAVGPAIGGIIVASAGAQAAFLLNALSYLGLIAVLLAWRRPATPGPLPPEGVGAAMRAGLRYVRLSPVIRTVLVRSMAFGLCGSAVWALMPLIARDLIGGGPLVYGLLLGAFGAGAVVGALASTGLRARHTPEAVVSAATLGFAGASLGTAFSSWLAVTLAALLVAGAGWVLALSSFNVTVQLWAPRWVVGRAMAVYQTVTFGGMAVGSWLWGFVAHAQGLTASLAIAGLAMALSALLALRLPLAREERADLDPHHGWPDPEVNLALTPRSGPVVVAVEYRVREPDWPAFLAAMQDVRRIRRRDGARRWRLLQDVGEPELWIERFQSPTWLDHLRQHHRVTVADRAIEARALSLHAGPSPPQVRHMLERPPSAASALADGAPDEHDPAIVTDPRLPPVALAHAAERRPANP